MQFSSSRWGLSRFRHRLTGVVWLGFQSDRPPVSVTHPHLVTQTEADLSKVTSGSDKKFTWTCELGHEWIAQVKVRCRGSGCPVCGNKIIVVGFNDLTTTHPDIAAECLDDPSTLTAGNDRKVRWRCRDGHEWEAATYSRIQQGTGCPYCSGRFSIAGVSDLASTHPHLVSEALFDATTVKAGSHTRVRWRCSEGHEWETSVSGRALTGAGCPYCAGQRVITGVNDLATLFPALAEEAQFDASQVMAGSSQRLPWKCSQGHEWKTTSSSRVSAGSGCPMCAGQRVITGVNDLLTLYPDIAKEALFDPAQVMWGSNKKLNWRCPSGHEYVTRVADRTADGAQCPYCQGRKVLVGFNDFATTHPLLAQQCLDDPTSFTAGSGKKVKWRCGIGHEWRSVVGNRVSKELGCPFCSGQRVLAGFNDLATVNPTLAREAVDFDCTTVTAGSGVKVRWRCEKGHEWKAIVANRNNGIGCPSCAVTGYDPNKKGYLYLLVHPDWEMTQVGISNRIKQRVREHELRGWVVTDVRGPMDGWAVKDWESSILGFLKAQGVKLGPMTEGRFSGRTESWLTDDYPVVSLRVLMDAVDKADA
jgi:hypothetical protein